MGDQLVPRVPSPFLWDQITHTSPSLNPTEGSLHILPLTPPLPLLLPSMAEFVQCPNPLKPSLPFTEMEQSLDVMSHFDELSGSVVMENPNLGFMGNSSDNFLPFLESFSGFLPIECPKPAVSPTPVTSAEKKRKAEAASETNSVSSSATPSETKKKNVCTLCYINFVSLITFLID